MVTFEDFKKLDIKIGKVKSAEKVPETDKLLKLIFDFGTENRQIIASLAEYFPEPETLIGKEMPVLMNLEPRNFKGNISEGMIIAADDGKRPVLLCPEEEIAPGSIVR
jgi:methionine--tRNA ligase beta chain